MLLHLDRKRGVENGDENFLFEIQYRVILTSSEAPLSRHEVREQRIFLGLAQGVVG